MVNKNEPVRWPFWQVPLGNTGGRRRRLQDYVSTHAWQVSLSPERAPFSNFLFRVYFCTVLLFAVMCFWLSAKATLWRLILMQTAVLTAPIDRRNASLRNSDKFLTKCRHFFARLVVACLALWQSERVFSISIGDLVFWSFLFVLVLVIKLQTIFTPLGH